MRRAILLLIGLPLLGGIAEGNRAYRAGDARGAAAVYARRLAEGDSSAVVRYNLGTALLRMGRWDDARPHLEAAAGAARVRRELAMRAHYNAGNADLEPAWRGRGDGADPRRVERLHRAVARYKQALRLDPADLDAKWNLELAQKLLRQEEQSGGGGAQDEESGGGGEGAQDEEPRPSPGEDESPQDEGADAPRLSRAEAERILSGAARQERETQEELLGRNRGAPRPVRDW